MIEPSRDIESRLAALRPAPIGPSLEARIDAALARPGRAQVAGFWTIVAGGAVAAAMIVTMLVPVSTGAAGRTISESAVIVLRAAPPSSALARADFRWGDDLNLESERRIP